MTQKEPLGAIDSIDDLKPDAKNARRHSRRNVETILGSLQEVGTARSIVIDEGGTVLAGNATVAAAREAGIDRVRVVESDGKEIIAVRRAGLTDAEKSRLALADNRASELGEWDGGVLRELGEDATAGLFREDELDDILAEFDMLGSLDDELGQDRSANSGPKGSGKAEVRPVLLVEDVAVVERAMAQTGIKDRGAALVAVCRAYVEEG